MTTTYAVSRGASADRPGALALAFDLDGPTGDAMLSGELWERPGYFCLGAYGPHRAVPRILDILRNSGVQATFFTPSWVVEHWPDLCRRIVDQGHEMANHGHRHEVFFEMSESEQLAVLDQAQAIFRRELGLEAAGFRAPSGDWHPRTAQLLAESGFRYSSSLRSGDQPFRHDGHSLIEIPAKSLFDDYTAFAYHRAPNFPSGLDRVAAYRPAFETWWEEIDAAADAGLTVTTIWHPKVIGTPGRALLLEELVDRVSRDPRIRVGTCADAVGLWAEGNNE
ncbi:MULTISPECIES: polysaccharide deacetylase family protein [Streptomyces]|uniref:polysaccharide deacetylase family protein n=1 Tax=Streptomyces lycopersici TaxID=2974589 RepID=UPI0021CF22EE|nr:polysaccharide deacetylase family protein [Streptomyces sp. NEAU-383]